MVAPRWAAAGLLVIALGAGVAPAPAGPIDDKLIPLERYATPKARALGSAHQPHLYKYSEHIYGCLPWLDVQKASIGFQRPKFAEGDDRYFSTWIIVDQKDDPEFAKIPQARRMSAMFSRFGMDLLRRMATVHDVVTDDNVSGFSVVTSWLKPGSLAPGGQPVNESIAVFVDKKSALDYVEKRITAADLTTKARWLAFDGQKELPNLPLEIWDDFFMASFKVPNYEPPPGITC